MEKTACLIVDVQQSVVAALPDGGEELDRKIVQIDHMVSSADGAAGLCPPR